jgi:hypothetical protein
LVAIVSIATKYGILQHILFIALGGESSSVTREDHITFLQKEAIHKNIYLEATKSIAIHLMSITSKVITSYLPYHGEQRIWRSTSLWHMLQMQSMIQRYKHNMIHKWKCSMHMYINPPNRSFKKEKTPTSSCKRANVAWSKGLVRISASYFSVGTWMRSMFPFSTLSLRKWYLTSMCLVLE